jgi:type IV pilus assembly protein PilO
VAINRALLNRLPLAVKTGICLGAMVLVAAGYFFVFHSDVVGDLEQAKNTGASLTQDLTKARAAEQAYQKDLAELAEREQRQKELNQILPATTEYPAFLSAVQSAANVSGVSLSAWTPRDRVPGKYYAKVPMKVELTGRFHQIARFFYNVGQLDRIINMEDISMTEPTLVDDEMTLKAEALATAFHVVETAEEASKDKKDAKASAVEKGK